MPVQGDWTRGSQTVTIDTRGINAGTAEGQAALIAAESMIRESGMLGNSASAAQASSFNGRAQAVANQVSRVAEAHRSEAAERAASDAYVRNYVASQYRRR